MISGRSTKVFQGLVRLCCYEGGFWPDGIAFFQDFLCFLEHELLVSGTNVTGQTMILTFVAMRFQASLFLSDRELCGGFF